MGMWVSPLETTSIFITCVENLAPESLLHTFEKDFWEITSTLHKNLLWILLTIRIEGELEKKKN